MELAKLTLGADPELFVSNEKGVIVPAHDMIPGTKEKPFPVAGGAVQVDGVAVEYNVDPSTSVIDFVNKNGIVLRQLEKMLPKGHSLVAIPDHTFPAEVWGRVPEEAKRLGCDPDRNAWEGKVNVVPEPPEGYRTAAGHVHIGWTEDMDPNDPEHLEACEMFAKQLDVSIGFISLLFEAKNNRRSLYGRAGDFRAKPYGMEYRTLSNFWVKDRFLARMVMEEVIYAFRSLERCGEIRGALFGEHCERHINFGRKEVWNTGLTAQPQYYYRHLFETMQMNDKEYGHHVRH